MPLCPNKTICGSCEWSETPYDSQLEQKLSGIKSAFAVEDINTDTLKIIPSPKTSHYRNRIDVAIDYQGNFGFREKGKWWKIIDGHICFLADEKIEELYKISYAWVKNCGLSFWDRKKHTGLLRYIVFRSTLKDETLINVITSKILSEEESQVITALEDLSKKTKATTLIWSQNSTESDVSFGDIMKIISGDGYIHEEINEITYRIYPNSFFQTNSYGAQVLQNEVLRMVKNCASGAKNATQNEVPVVDLYCGAGFFSMALKKALPQARVIGIEEVEDAITGANTNAHLNFLDVEFTKAKSEEIDLRKIKPDLVVADPPRVGLHPKVLLNLLDSASQNIIYVSCRYQNFVRDYKLLQKKYELVESVAVDMFPHTPHVELVTHLRRWN